MEIKDSKPLTIDYNISNSARIIFARFFDFVLSSIIPLVLALTYNHWHLKIYFAVLIILLVTLILLIIYFIVTPYYWNGMTLMKWVFRIKLFQPKTTKIKLLHIINRELIIVFIPWFIVLINSLVISSILEISFGHIFANPTSVPKVAIVFTNIASIFYLLWYLGLIINLIATKTHQIAIDKKYTLFIINIKPLKEIKTKKKLLITSKEKHVHLSLNQPGNIDDLLLDNLDKKKDKTND